MKISHKLILSFLLVASLSSTTLIFTLRSYDEIDKTFARMMGDSTKTIEILNSIKHSGERIISSTNEIGFLQNEVGASDSNHMIEDEKKLTLAGYTELEGNIARYKDLVLNVSPNDANTQELIRATGAELIETSKGLIELKSTNIRGPRILEKKVALQQQELTFLNYVNRALINESGEQVAEQADVVESIALATRKSLVATALTFILAIFSGLYISFLISRRVKNLKAASQKVGGGELDTQIEIDSKDELGDLSRSFNQMIVNLKKSQSDILAAHRFTDTILASMANVLLVLDLDLTIVRANQTAIDLCQFTSDEMVGKPIKTLAPDARFLDERDILELRSNGSVSGIETFLKRKDQREIPVLVSASLMRDIDGTICGIVCVAQDVTERRLLEDKVQRGQKLESIGQLAAGIAHEINTPTQYVGDNVKFLEESFADIQSVLEKNEKMIELCRSEGVIPEFTGEMQALIERADIDYLMREVPKAFRQALTGVERIAKIVQSMKDFAHPGVTEKRSADLNKAIESTITVASNEWKYVADIETHYDEELPLVLCQIGAINQVVLNMIVNAAHTIGDALGENSCEKGKITVDTEQSGNWVEIRITDTGKGIAPDGLKKIFDPFYTTKEVGKGTGQGLAISHSIIVEKHQGTIDVKSELGVGTTFIIRLPISQEATGEKVEAERLQAIAV